MRLKKDTVCFRGLYHSGAVKIGIRLSHFIDKHEQTIIIADGMIEFTGSCIIGSGTKIVVSRNCHLNIGRNFNVTGNLHVCCEKGISIGDDCMISWNVTLLDTDYHPIKQNGIIINEPRKITIGNHVWIGCDCTILKGVKIPDSSIIAAGSTVRKNLRGLNAIYGQHTSNITCIKENLEWFKECF